MSAPKSITKTQYKDGKTILTFTNEVDKCQYYINELNRGALRDVAKFVISKFAENILNTFNSRKTIVNKKGKEVPNLSNMKKQAFYSVWASKNTIYPRVQIGLNLKENTGDLIIDTLLNIQNNLKKLFFLQSSCLIRKSLSFKNLISKKIHCCIMQIIDCFKRLMIKILNFTFISACCT